MTLLTFETVNVKEVKSGVYSVSLNRPKKLNAFNSKMWAEIKSCFQALNAKGDCRAIVLSAEGRMFTAGVDLQTFATVSSEPNEPGENENYDKDDIARKGLRIYATGRDWQDSMTALEECSKPIIACIHNACIGAGLEMISAADIRFVTADGYFQYKEGDVGMAADVGGLQRFPKIVGNQSLVRELVFSGRKMKPEEALRLGLVSRVCNSKEEMLEEAVALAEAIAAKSPIATVGAKKFLNYSRDHSVADSLEYAIAWNMAMLQGSDMMRAMQAGMTKSKANFPRLPNSKL
mmetsp:Transcript_9473/g.12388  ORF Transcript_9473/g.12388 Transcript_9473/m.12388 type:complete len:291 (-) Transcript_9473:337-1209(-)